MTLKYRGLKHNPRFGLRALAPLAFLTILGGVSITPAMAQTVVAPAPQPEIVVQGTGEVTVTPDMARLSFSVQTEDKDSAQAVQANANRMEAVLKAIRAAGIPDKDIRTVGFNLSALNDYKDGKSTFRGYQATNTVRVTVRRLADTGKVIDAATKAGANGSGGIELALNEADAKKAAEDALAKAVADAERKALVIARAANIAFISVHSITDNGGDDGGPRPMMLARANMASDAATPIQAGEQKITANVTVKYGFGAQREIATKAQ